MKLDHWREGVRHKIAGLEKSQVIDKYRDAIKPMLAFKSSSFELEKMLPLAWKGMKRLGVGGHHDLSSIAKVQIEGK